MNRDFWSFAQMELIVHVHVVVEASAHTDACGPALDVANVFVGVVVVAHVKSDEVVELETLFQMSTQSPRKSRNKCGRRTLTLKRPFAQERSSTLTQGKSKLRTS